MSIAWTPRLAVGVESIDQQHKELFAHVNALVAAMLAQRSDDEVRRVIGFLGEYVVSHFGAEERLMTQHGYPDLPAHRREHEAFVQDLERLRGELQQPGPLAALAVELNHRVCDWLIEHIGVADRALGTFLARRGAPAGPRP